MSDRVHLLMQPAITPQRIGDTESGANKAQTKGVRYRGAGRNIIGRTHLLMQAITPQRIGDTEL